MAREEYLIRYPRKRFARGVVRGLGRLLLPLLFHLEVEGRENFPVGGPLVAVGNHVAVMEAVMMTICTPWQVEVVGAADIPHEKISELSIRVFGYIPVNRGHVDRPALSKALDVLRQGGVIGLFPEGGVWDAGAMQAQTGVAWLSYRASAPVLPIGFSGTQGALGAALKLRRPPLKMRVGQVIPAARLPAGVARKEYLQSYATRVMDGVKALLPEGDPSGQPQAVDERFELEIVLENRDGQVRPCPASLEIQHGVALAKMLHRPTILKIFAENLELPVEPLQRLHLERDPSRLAAAVVPILEYLEQENPYLLKYRFGGRQGDEMEQGVRELLALTRWASEEELEISVVPVRRYYSPESDREVVQTEQDGFRNWM